MTSDEDGRVQEQVQISNRGSEMSERLNEVLIGSTDAQVWAREFVRLIEHTPRLATDEGTMLGWFANAIEAGRDAGMKQERQRSFDDRVREIAYQAAGAGAGAVMQKAPTVVMPDDEIAATVNKILAENGVEGYGGRWLARHDAEVVDG